MSFVLHLTEAGEAAIQGASGSDPVVIAELGLTNTPFVNAPTLTALPGEFKRVDALAGEASAPNITHMSAYDTSSDVWDATGFGLFDDAGTLIAVYSSDNTVMSKAAPAFALLVFDIAWNADLAANIDFGNPIFTSPPATTEIRGLVELATDAEADAGTDTARALTPASAKQAVLQWLLGQDGSGSGLDADLLDGQNGAWYADIVARLGYAPLVALPGAIQEFALPAAPAGYLACDGSAVSRETYAALFAAIGTLYGVGDGATTFNLPLAHDRVRMGAGGAYAVGDTGGAAAHNHGGSTGDHALSAAELAAHNHAMFANVTNDIEVGVGSTAAVRTSNSPGEEEYTITSGGGTPATKGITGDTGDGDPHSHPLSDASNLPPFIAFLVCIKT